MSDPFITTADLGAYLQRIDIDMLLGEMACAQASEAVRNYCGTEINLVEGDIVLVDGSGTGVLLIPDVPVRNITDVLVDGASVSDWTMGAGGLLYRDGLGVWPKGPLRVTIIYDHGFSVIPEDIRRVALALAARIYAAGGVVDTAPVIDQLLTMERSLLDRYRIRGIGDGFWRAPTSAPSSSSSSSSSS